MIDADQKRRNLIARQLGISLAVPVLLLLTLGVVLSRQILRMSDDARWLEHSDRVLTAANSTLKQIIDQETGERGYLVTAQQLFLEPFDRARPGDGFAHLHDLVADNPAQVTRFEETRRRYQRWLDLVTPAVNGVGLDKARTAAAMLEGKRQMDSVREAMQAALDAENALRLERQTASADTTQTTRLLLFVLLAGSAMALAFFSRRQINAVASRFEAALQSEREARQALEQEAWLETGLGKVVEALQGDPTIEQLGERALAALAGHTGAAIGAFFTREGGQWRRRAGHALDPRAAGPEAFELGEGLIGSAAHEGKLRRLSEIPPGYLRIRSGTGETSPREILVFPTTSEQATNAVLELGFLQAAPVAIGELLERASGNIAVAVRSAGDRKQLRALLEEAQRQAEELQTQQEELRVSNEELEAQTTALRAAQQQLQTQQAELEQTNDHLVQQSAILERQNEQLAQSQAAIASKAEEVERASRFKSEFLANMSHELRTPLNSSLILAKLLSENKAGNLTAEQVKFAETIHAAGNDLLALINDVLDLSKIEAGHTEINVGEVALAGVRENLARTFEPVAAQRKLALTITFHPSAPATLRTDRQKVEQILKNLIANALKFTERGEVALEIQAEGDAVTFAIRDTGIGIPEDQQELIFEAFRQAEATPNRRYGGTGLGLSISRELAHLLGGEVTVHSTPGQGSIFTLRLPRAYAGPLSPVAPTGRPGPPPLPAAPVRPAEQAARAAGPAFGPGQRLVLIVEDDERFADLLATVAREAGFQAVHAATAPEGLELARAHLPAGIVLDLKLREHLGLTLLDRLKRDPKTRHIPVHVISALDQVELALSMGAAAYLHKPVDKEQLLDVFRQLEARSTGGARRVLVVEDDPALRDSVVKLLGQGGTVTIDSAASVGEALSLLRKQTFDCVVTDLGLPDRSGFELLETMAQGEPYSFPPVVVYTGRALTADEEQRLRRYSRSIIVKGARSPERLLDEVTLFLHEVESNLSPEQQRLLAQTRHREAVFEGRTILVVEDDVRNVFALTNALEPRGARVAIARNGREALKQLAALPSIDLVLMDIMMPEMDGYEATREIRKNPRWAKLPIIALTAKAMPDDQERCLAVGMNDYTAKPLDIEILLSLLRVWMPKT